ncbi:MAG TPA: type IV pilus assembly protein PilM [Nitrospiria bacterium]|nr:type IV pilus assembly protein PilM [Nitrospiria bacterium]
MFGLSKKQIALVGLDIGSSSIKLLQLKQGRKGYSLEKLGIAPIDSDLIVDGTVMDSGRVVEIIKGLVDEQKLKTRAVAFSVSGHSVIVKKIILPAMTEDELEESIKFEAEQYIPFDINDVNIDFHVLGPAEPVDGKEQQEVLLVAVKKDKLTEYKTIVEEAGLVPMVVDVDAFTVENMFEFNYGLNNGVVALVNIGSGIMNINIMKNGVFSFTRDISIGGNKYTETIQKDLNLSFEEAEKLKKGEEVEGANPEAVAASIENMNSEIAAEIQRTFDYFKNTANQEQIDRIYLSGGGGKLRNLPQVLTEKLSLPVEMINPFKNISFDPKVFSPDYIQEVGPMAAVVLGLALRKSGDR